MKRDGTREQKKNERKLKKAHGKLWKLTMLRIAASSQSVIFGIFWTQVQKVLFTPSFMKQ